MPCVLDIDHVIVRHADLDRVERFFNDFGLATASRSDGRLYLRGAEPHPYCYVAELAERPEAVAIAFRVGSLDELRAATAIAGAGGIEALDAPGGGQRVSLRDPDGLRIDLVHGIAPADPSPMREPLAINHARLKRRYGETQRPARGPAQILRLGHALIFVTDFGRSVEWYRRNLGFLPSDILYDGAKENQVGVFLRCDRGEEWVDHHTFGIFKGPKPRVHHASFEVQDFDAQSIGHEWLMERGWTPEWGIGRHILGSQIFDYWRDPSGFLVEHFTDGDLFNRGSPTNYHQAAPETLYQWGPRVPDTFLA